MHECVCMRMWLFAIDYWVLVYQAKFTGLKSKVNDRIKIAPASAALLGTMVVNREECIEPFESKAIVFFGKSLYLSFYSNLKSVWILQSFEEQQQKNAWCFMHFLTWKQYIFTWGVLSIKRTFDNFSEFHSGFVVTLRKLIREWVGYSHSWI